MLYPGLGLYALAVRKSSREKDARCKEDRLYLMGKKRVNHTGGFVVDLYLYLSREMVLNHICWRGVIVCAKETT